MTQESAQTSFSTLSFSILPLKEDSPAMKSKYQGSLTLLHPLDIFWAPVTPPTVGGSGGTAVPQKKHSCPHGVHLEVSGGRRFNLWQITDLNKQVTAPFPWVLVHTRCLLLGRKAMTNLDSIKKQRGGKTQRDRIEREVGGGIRMGNTCKSMADSCQCMTKPTTIL